MQYAWNNGLPFLPGNTFKNLEKCDFTVPQTLVYKNGYSFALRPTKGIGLEPHVSEEIRRHEINRFSFDPLWTCDRTEIRNYEKFVPSYVALDKKVLHFSAYFTQNILFSQDETKRVRKVVISYFLEDDTICIIEPEVENSGIPQGTQIKRMRLPKNEFGEYYHWKDLNLGMDLKAFGVTYRIVECDVFTKEFMRTEGIILNEPEPMPDDHYTKNRRDRVPVTITHPTSSQKSKPPDLEGKVLRFTALWDDSYPEFENATQVSIVYYLVDDTVEIKKIQVPGRGRELFHVVLRRMKIPKRIKSETFPRIVLEISKEDVDEYVSAKDLQLGKTVKLLGHSFLLNDCDAFTREYYQENFPDMKLEVIKKVEVIEEEKQIPPYNGFGSLEDSLQNCLSLHPRRPKKNVVKMLENDNILSYVAKLDSEFPQDECREFTLSYYLSDDTITIYEKPVDNSGFAQGKFLSRTRIPKPGTPVDNPEYYSPADFCIGATIDVFSHRFVLVDAAPFVLKYLEANPSGIPARTLDSLRQKICEGKSKVTAE